MIYVQVVVLLGVCRVVLSAAFPAKNDAPQCGYQSCPVGEPDMLNVHIISHTHDDLGWLKTVDQYYYGAKNRIQNAGVQYILDSVVEELVVNSNRKFIYVETAFFWKWWNEQSDAVRHIVRGLVNSGQLEFIGGGWSMNDEAAADYNDIIDQMSLGLRRLRALFGDCGIPKVAWQIDPFGHSREQASLFAQMGFDGLFLGRIDYEDKSKRLENQKMEMMWNASANIGKDGQLFTGILFNTYSPPPGFCFDLLCDDEPIIDNVRSPDYNVNRRVDKFLGIVKEESFYYTTNNIPITMGNDFNYQSARSWFKNLDKLIKHVNHRQQTQDSKVNVFYSTPSCYLLALNKAHINLPVKTDDFFPYASDPHAYWTGYFTSRPALKGFVRQSNNFLQICKQLHFLSRQKGAAGDPEGLFISRENLGIAQHHDAVSGTAKQHVTNDYMRRLSLGRFNCQNLVQSAYQKLMSHSEEDPPLQIFCNNLNISQCKIAERSEKFTVTVYNPIVRPVNHIIRIPVTYGTFIVLGDKGETIIHQLVPIPKSVLYLAERKSNATHELIFEACLPPVGFITFFISKANSTSEANTKTWKPRANPTSEDIILSNRYLRVIIDGGTGLLRSLINFEESIKASVSQNFYWYRGMTGNNTEYNLRASGAYIFRPNGTSPRSIAATATTRVIRGPVVDEVHQVFNEWVTQVIRLPKNAKHVELEWMIGPVPVNDKIGKEVISLFQTDLNSEGVFYTDSNGREVLRRVRNQRPTWQLTVTEPIAGNYYPVNSRLFIRDEKKSYQMTLLTDRSVGGGSMNDGAMELMLHRRLLNDDAFGVGEALNEPGFDGKGLVVRGRTILLLNSIGTSPAFHRDLAQKLMMSPQLTFTNSSLSPSTWAEKFATQFSAVKAPLPANVHLLTLEPLSNPFVLVRIEHFFEKTECPQNLSKPVTVDLQNLFEAFTISSVTETNLAANQLLSEVQRLDWHGEDNHIPPLNDIPKEENYVTKNSTEVVLQPMQIRSFILRLILNS